MNKVSISQKAVLLSVFAQFVGAWMDLINKVLTFTIDPIFVIFVRSYIVILMMHLLLRGRFDYKKVFALSNTNKLILFVTGMTFGLGVLLMTTGVKYGADLVTVPIISATIPFFVYIFSKFILGTKLNVQSFGAIILSIYGVLIITFNSFMPEIKGLNIGEAYVAFSVIFFAISSVLRKKLSEFINSFEITYGVMISIGIGMGFVELFSFKITNITNFTPWLFFLLLILSFFLIIFYSLTTFSIKHLGPTLAIMIDRVKILFSALIAFMVFREIPDLFTLLGGLIIILGIVLFNYIEKKSAIGKSSKD